MVPLAKPLIWTLDEGAPPLSDLATPRYSPPAMDSASKISVELVPKASGFAFVKTVPPLVKSTGTN
jgi:hypothetical protein